MYSKYYYVLSKYDIIFSNVDRESLLIAIVFLVNTKSSSVHIFFLLYFQNLPICYSISAVIQLYVLSIYLHLNPKYHEVCYF